MRFKYNIYSAIFIFSVSFSIGFLNISYADEENTYLENHKFSTTDLYLDTYNTISNDSLDSKEAVKMGYNSTANMLGISRTQLEAMTIPNSSPAACKSETDISCAQNLLEKYCDLDNGQYKFADCQKKLNGMISQQIEYSRDHLEIQRSVLSMQAFVNGTLQDTGSDSFDIIVDLNILDTILFGEKMTVPKTGSPFLPYNPFKDDEDDESNSSVNSDNNENSDDSSDDNNSDNLENTENNNDDTSEEDEFSNLGEFCADPESLIFSDTITVQVLDINTTFQEVAGVDASQENSSYEDIQTGNIITSADWNQPGYPDFSRYKSKGCDDGEQSFLGGLMCIPEFCTELLCIKVNLKTGYADTANRRNLLQRVDCVECHIDRGNEALKPFIATLGQGTPNSNPMEAFFLSAFSNLYKDVTNGITLKPKRLPFLVYDNPLNKQKKEKDAIANGENLPEEQTLEQKKEEIRGYTEETEDWELMEFYKTSRKIDCSEVTSIFNKGEGDLGNMLEYCKKIGTQTNAQITQEQKSVSSSNDISNAEVAEKQIQRSETYHNVITPFLSQISMDMVLVNQHINDIDPANIQKTSRACRIN